MENEKRLIDFEKARKSVMEILAGKVNTPTAVKVSVAMQEATVDAVEVVRCKDCHNCTKSKWCNLLMMDVKDEWFCSHGERKDNEK